MKWTYDHPLVLTNNQPDSSTHVCDLPWVAKELRVENGCMIALSERGEKFLIPVEAEASAIRN